MGFKFKKSIKIAPGVKLNLNKKSASISFGVRGLRKTYSTSGRKTSTVGIPGTGLYYTDVKNKKTAKEKNIDRQKYNYDDTPINKVFDIRVYACLALFLGGLGVHKFYKKDYKKGLIYLLFCWTLIPFIVSIIEGISLIIKYQKERRSN